MISIIDTKIQKYKLNGINYLMNCIKIAVRQLIDEEVYEFIGNFYSPSDEPVLIRARAVLFSSLTTLVPAIINPPSGVI